MSCIIIVDRCGPEGMRITQVFKGSNEANVTWSFPGDIAHDLECFRLSVKRKSGDGDDIYSKNVAATNKNDTITNLRPNMDYVVTVTAIYRDAIERKSSLEHLGELRITCVYIPSVSLERSSPKELKITQDISGSPQAVVEWSFPKECDASLLKFSISATKEGDTHPTFSPMFVDPQLRRHIISGLQSTNYIILGARG